MALFGLLGDGGGGGSPLDLYGDLFTPEQKAALQSRELSQGLFRMAEKLGQAAQPSRVPVSTLGALGSALGAFGTGSDMTEQALKGMQIAEQVRQLKSNRDFQQKYLDPVMLEWLKRRRDALASGAPGAVPTVPGAPVAPTGSPPASNAPPLPPIGSTPTPAPPAGAPGAEALPDLLSPITAIPGFEPLPGGGFRALPPGATPQQQSGLLPPPPGANPQMGQGGGLLAGLPFDPGAGGDNPDLSNIRIVPLSGEAAPAGQVDVPFPTVGAPGDTSGSAAWKRGFTYDAPARPYDPSVDRPANAAVGPEERGLLARAKAPSSDIPPPQAAKVGEPSAGRAARIKFWTDQGMPQHVAEGIADRVGAESNYNPAAIGDNGTSGGMYQHHADRLARLQAFAAQQNLPWTDPGVQDRFAATEVRGGDAIATRGLPAIAAAPDRQTAAKLWDKYFERSAAGPGSGGNSGFSGRITPLGGEAVPAGAAPSGVIPGLNIAPEDLALMNMLAKRSGLGEPFNSLLETYYKSPGYLAEKARTEAQAQKDIALKMDPLIAAQTEREKLKVETELKPALEAAVATAVNGPLKDRAQAQADIDRITEQLKQAGVAGTNIQEATILGDDGNREIKKMTALEIAARQAAEAKRRAAGDTTPRPGDIVGTPVLSPGQTKSQELGVAAGWKALEDTHAREIDANRRLQSYGQIAEAMQGFRTGATAEARLYYKGILRDLGVIEGTDVPDGEVAQRAMRRLQLDAASVTKGSTSDYERGLIAQGAAQLGNTPEAVIKAIDQMRRLDEYDTKIAQIHRDVADKNGGMPNVIEAQRRIAALGPPLSPGELRALEKAREGQVPTPGAGAPSATPGTMPNLPAGVPAGSVPAGSYQGKPVYRLPDGTVKVLQ